MTPKSFFEQKLLFVFFIILSGIMALAIKTYKNNQVHENTTQIVENTKDALDHSAEISQSVKDLESSVKAFVITGDTSFLASFSTSQKNMLDLIARLKELTTGNPVQTARVSYLDSLVEDKLHTIQQRVRNRNREGLKSDRNLIMAKLGMAHTKRIDSLLSRFDAEERNLLKLSIQADTESSKNFTFFYSTLIVVLVTILTAFFIALWQNLKARKKVEISLLESKTLQQAIVDNTSSIIYVKDLKGYFTLVNKQFEKMYNLKSGEAIGKTTFDMLPRRYALQHTQVDQKVVKEGRLIEVEEEAEVNGKRNHFYSVKFPLRNQEGHIYAVGGISTNITEVITKQQLEKQREIAATTIEAQEKERNFLGRELHDNVNQLLTHAKLSLEVAATNPDMRETFIERCKQAILKAITEIRNLSHTLTSPSFEGNSFRESVRDLVEDMCANTIKTNLQFGDKDELDNLPSTVKVALYRIIQEQLSNVLKYSQAHLLTIDLKLLQRNIHLQIADDGVGFDTLTKPRGIGLRNIQSRVEFYSGHMNIVSAPNQGCKLQIDIPWQGYNNA